MGRTFGGSLGSDLLGWRDEVSVAETKTLIQFGRLLIHNLTEVTML